MLTQLINQSIDAFGDMLHLINVLFIFVSLPRHNFFFSSYVNDKEPIFLSTTAVYCVNTRANNRNVPVLREEMSRGFHFPRRNFQHDKKYQLFLYMAINLIIHREFFKIYIFDSWYFKVDDHLLKSNVFTVI